MFKWLFDQLCHLFSLTLLALLFSMTCFQIVIFFCKLYGAQAPEQLRTIFLICGVFFMVALKWFIALPIMPVSASSTIRIRLFQSQCEPPYDVSRDLWSQVYYPKGDIPISRLIFHAFLVGVVHLFLVFILSAAFFKILFSFYEVHDFFISNSMKIGAVFCGAMSLLMFKMFIFTPLLPNNKAQASAD